ncbi:MAG: TolC family protein [Bacteroidota bacterium]
MKPKQTFIFSLCLMAYLLPAYYSHAQSDILESYVQEGLERNLSLKQQDLVYDKAVSALQEAKGLFLPQVSAIANYTLAGGGRTLDFPIGDLFNPVYATLNELTERQQFPTNLENVEEQFLPHNFQESKLRIVQPLFNSGIYFNRRAKQALISVEEAKKQAFRQDVSKDIRVAYFSYLKTVEVGKIYQETAPLLEEILRVNERLVANDKATREVVYAAQHEVSKLAQQQAQALRQQQMAKAYMNFLLNRPLDQLIEVDSSFQPSPMREDLNGLEDLAMQERGELRHLTLAQAANTEAIELHRSAWLPQINAVLDVGFQGYGYNWGKEQDYWLGQVSLQWDLFQGGQRKARVQQAKIDQEILLNQQSQLEQQLRLQVQEAYYKLTEAQSAIEAAKAGLRSAQQAYRLSEKKYRQDQANFLELTDARTRMTQARISLAIASYDLLIQQADLQWAIGR